MVASASPPPLTAQELPVRHCWICQAEIRECMGFTLARDVLALEAGTRKEMPRESCSRCADRLAEYTAPLLEQHKAENGRLLATVRTQEAAHGERLDALAREIEALRDDLIQADAHLVATERQYNDALGLAVTRAQKAEAEIATLEARVHELDIIDHGPFDDKAKQLSAALYELPAVTEEQAGIIIDAARFILSQSRSLAAALALRSS